MVDVRNAENAGANRRHLASRIGHADLELYGVPGREKLQSFQIRSHVRCAVREDVSAVCKMAAIRGRWIDDG